LKTMDPLAKDIKNGEFARAYLFKGAERYLIRERVKRLLSAAAPEGALRDMNVTVFEGKSAGAEAVRDAADTAPFFAERRVVVCRECGFFAPGRKDESDALAAYIPTIPEWSMLILAEQTADARLNVYKRLAKTGRIIDCEKPGDADAARWAVKFAEKRGGRLDPRVADMFLRYVPREMDVWANELQKLVDYAGDRPITEDDIKSVCVRSIESGIFALVGAIGQGDAKKALNMFADMLSLKEPPLRVLAMIERQFRLIMLSKSLAERGAGRAEVAARLGLRDFQAREYIAQSANFTRRGIERALERCLAADADIKSGRMRDRLAVELVILCRD
jgi:DNA polymerase-3 subunit delta